MSDQIDTQDQTEDEDLDLIGLSDEDFLAQDPSNFAGGSAEENDASLMAAEGETQASDDEDDKPVAAAQGETQAPVADADGSVQSHTTPHQSEAPQAPQQTGQEASPAAVTQAQPVDYEATYKQIMAPFKANGKEFTPSSPEEVVRLMQMGANYTKKMQALKPNLQLMRMLENNGLLDEAKLSFLIDVDKKDPKAIQKLLHDAKIDPLEIDASEAPAYTPGNHRVSDQEMAFHEALSDVATTETGKETIVLINSKWDNVSKQAVFKEPVLLSIITEQRSNGIYDQIVSEIERQQTLGLMPNIPFIQAYKQVGDRLHAEGKLVPRGASQPQPQLMNPAPVVPQRQVLETRPAQPKSPVSNGEKARAASPGPKASTKSSPQTFDPFSMTDEEIMAIPAPRF